MKPSEVTSEYLSQTSTSDDVVYAASQAAETYFSSMFDPSDPSMTDKDEWDNQVAGAVYELESEMQQLLEKIEKKLVDGGYHKWQG